MKRLQAVHFHDQGATLVWGPKPDDTEDTGPITAELLRESTENTLYLARRIAEIAGPEFQPLP